ncbi:inheritance of peroxisomes protein 2 [Saccharomyces pastorianus]|uniref:Inheritance of peroxisomes protein 2 n=2 Tax=Saccharomyces TaxID=4930 RepID=A0A6C1EDY6_SACPS|nr:inheritance of peroxisomes protein 2 [Saccharomyces pastorianus]CAI1642660.1 hypothetical protein SEUBUCD650_0M02940 [Saccharomyces eubayanus]
MARSSRPPLLQVPGLQIFSKLKSDEEDGFMSSSSTLDRDTIVGISESNHQEFYSTWRKPSQLSNRSVLHEYSPTVIGSNGRIFTPLSFKIPARHFNWDDIISKIFLQPPFGLIHKFFEEYQYSIITSHFLNDLNRYRLSLHINQSIMNFREGSVILKKVPLNSGAFMATKYGKLAVVEEKKMYFKRTFDYISVMLTSYKLLRQLKKCCKEKSDPSLKRVVTPILAAIYLSLQQEYFRNHLICYKTLVEVQKMLRSLQQVDVMIHKYHLRYKEIKNSRVTSKVALIPDTEGYSSMIEELLIFSSDALFYKLKTVIGDIVISSDTSELSKYCEIYGIDVSSLYHNTTLTIKDLDGKLCRLKMLKKFMLCCLLSLDTTGSNSLSNSSIQNALNKIFPDYLVKLQQKKKTNLIDTFQNITNLLKDLHPLLSAVLMSLNDHKHTLYPLSEELLPNDGGEESDLYSCPKSDQTLQALNHLKAIENDILAINVQNGITKNDKKTIQNKLEELIAFWKASNISTNNDIESGKKVPVTNISNHGFHLDIFKGRKVSSSSLSVRRLNLERKVEFIDVNESENESFENDTELENSEDYASDERSYEARVDLNHPVDFTGTLTCKRTDFKQLSDNELRRKLDERILKLARENREGRERLRTAKSFELLRNTRSSIETELGFQESLKKKVVLESGSLSKYKLSSEETIPFLYELEQLIGKNS